jgi:hypothetical protein
MQNVTCTRSRACACCSGFARSDWLILLYDILLWRAWCPDLNNSPLSQVGGSFRQLPHVRQLQQVNHSANTLGCAQTLTMSSSGTNKVLLVFEFSSLKL